MLRPATRRLLTWLLAASRCSRRACNARQHARLHDVDLAGISRVRRLDRDERGVSRPTPLRRCAGLSQPCSSLLVTASLMLLPKNQTELARWFSVSALGLLAVCYLGVLWSRICRFILRAISGAQLAGDWRGSFGHKNVAAGMMAMLLFVGIYVLRAGSWISGHSHPGADVGVSGEHDGKSSLALCVPVLMLTSFADHYPVILGARGYFADAACAAQVVRHRHRDERHAGRTRQQVAVRCELYRPHRYLDLRMQALQLRCIPDTASRRSGAAPDAESCRGYGVGGHRGA